jgi:hypothetical protein
MELYKSIDVWERQDNGTVVRFRCFQSLINGKYCVQSADFYHDTTRPQELDQQFIELLSEQDPAQRAGEYATLEEAVAAHKSGFAS